MGAWRIRSLIATVLLSTAALPAVPAVAAAPTGDARSTAVAAAQVDALTAEYRRRSAASALAAGRLAQAYSDVDAADSATQTDADRVARARATGAAQVLALYARGPGTDDDLLALLAADSPDDALWRLSIGIPIAQRITRDARRAEQHAEQQAATTTDRSTHVLTAAAGIGQLLANLRNSEDAASAALDRARAELTRLTAQERQQEEVRAAAARLELARRAAATARLAASGPVGALGIPAEYERDYRDAATTCSGLDWTLLAAVGQVESGHGRNNGPSSAGAIGPMQFMPATFAAYAVDGDGDGTADAWNPRDAAFTAARYLCASGAGNGPDGVHAALLAYNHAEWYVDLVLAAQTAIRTRQQQG